MAGTSGEPAAPEHSDSASEPGAPAPGTTERIAFAGGVAVLRPGSIAIRPSRVRLLGPAIEGALAIAAAVAIATLLPVLPLWALLLLLLTAMLLGPIAVLGIVYNVAGSSVLVERAKSSVRYQQGFLGLGIGTAELVPFWRIARFELVSSDEELLTSGERQELVEWEVRLVKDNGRVLPVAAAVAPAPFADEARVRAARLADALAEMTGSAVETREPADDVPVEAALDGADEGASALVGEHAGSDEDGGAAEAPPLRRRRRRRGV